MKKSFLIFIAGILLTVAVSYIFGSRIILKAYKNETQTVENIAGAVLSEFPEAERIFVSAVTDREGSTEAAGKSIMSKYGYDSERSLDESFVRYISVYRIINVAAVFCILALAYSAAVYIKRRRQKQERCIVSLLDDCLSGNFGFTGDEQKLNELGNPIFADLIVKLGESLRLKQHRLEEEQDNTKALVTDISHQLKTPVSAVKACFAVWSEAEDESEREEFINRSKSQIDRLEALLAALVNVSRLESGMIELKKDKVMLTQLIVGAVNSVCCKALKKDIRIETSGFEDTELWLDEKWTVEAIANVLDNAVKYSPSKSSIGISVQKLYSFARVEIKDCGPGIAQEERNKIFRRFYRGTGEFVRREAGSGVGLYLTRNILERQGGAISARSGADGAVFIIQLPL